MDFSIDFWHFKIGSLLVFLSMRYSEGLPVRLLFFFFGLKDKILIKTKNYLVVLPLRVDFIHSLYIIHNSLPLSRDIRGC